MSRAQAIARLVGLRGNSPENPKDMIETYENGYPLTAAGKDLTEHVKKLEEVKEFRRQEVDLDRLQRPSV